MIITRLHIINHIPYTTLFRSLRTVDGIDAVDCDGRTLRVTVRDLLDVSPRMLLWIREHGYRCSHIASQRADLETVDRKSTRLNSSHTVISYAVFCLKKKI